MTIVRAIVINDIEGDDSILESQDLDEEIESISEENEEEDLTLTY